MLPVLVIIAVITALAVLAFRWFERYRYSDAWRTSEFRGAAFGFLMWFGGIFGHRVPPPPQAKMELTTRAGVGFLEWVRGHLRPRGPPPPESQDGTHDPGRRARAAPVRRRGAPG